MQATRSADGVVVTLKPGQAICATDFSSITISADEIKHVRESDVELKMYLQWLEHLIVCRMRPPYPQCTWPNDKP